MEIDGESYFKISDLKKYKVVPNTNCLLSDATHRSDINLLKENKLEDA